MGWTNAAVSPETRELMDNVLDAAFYVHRKLGPGYLGSIYRRCFVHALRKQGLQVEEEVWLPVLFDDLFLDRAQRADIVVEGRLLIEVKATEGLVDVHRAQVVSYLKSTGFEAGLLMSFNVRYFKTGYDRIVHPALVADPRTRGTLLTAGASEEQRPNPSQPSR